MDRKDDNPYAAPQSELHIVPVAQLATTYQPATVLSADIPRGPEWAKVVNGAELFRLTIFFIGFGIISFFAVVTIPITFSIAYVFNAWAMWLIRYPLQFCGAFFWLRIALVLQFGLGILAIIFAVYTSYKLYNENNQWQPPFYLPFIYTPILLSIVETIALILTIAAIHGFGKKYQIAYLQKYLKWDLLLITLMVLSFLALLILSQVGADRSLGDLLAGIFFISLFVQFILIRFHIHFAMYHLQNLARQLINSDTEIVSTSTGAYSTLYGDEMSFLYPQAKRAPEPWHGPTIM